MRFLLLVSLLLLMAFAPDSASSAGPPPGTWAAQWKKIDALLAKNQTATAGPLVEAIYEQARRAQNTPDYIRALLYKVQLLEAKEEDAQEKAIALLEKDLATATFPARPILHSLLAGLYTQYLNQHRYRLYQRTAGSAPTAGAGANADTGLATWDMARLGSAIVRHYEKSVAEEPKRQLQTSLAQLGALAAGGDAEGRALRPSLYDLLAQRAIQGLQNQELYITRPAQQFQLTEPRLFGPAAEFAALRLLAPAADSLNGQLRALQLLQQLTASRLQLASQNQAALADIDLQRLDYLRRLTQYTDLGRQYEPALAQMTETYQNLPSSAEFVARQAEAQREKAPVAAVRLAREAEARFPKSRGAVRARALRAQLERQEVSFSAPSIVVPGQPWRLEAATRNVSALQAQAYRLTLKEWEQFYQYDGRNRPVAQRYARALRAAPAATWAVPVAPHPLDYQEHKLASAGAALPVGHYLLVLSSTAADDARRSKSDPAVAYAVLGVSGLSPLRRNALAAGGLQLLVLQRQSGQVLPGVNVQAIYTRYDRKTGKEQPSQSAVLQTSASGEITVPPAAPPAGTQEQNIPRLRAVRVWRGADTLLLSEVGGYYYHQAESNAEVAASQRQTFLFTDRAIYRPGQTLYFKGILTQGQGPSAGLSVLSGQPVSVRLVDVNGQTVQALPFMTSEFGSFHGSVVLPTGLLNGEMSLQTDHGSISFAVEDYKRPTFVVQLDSVPGRPQLGQPLTVSGRARAYAGQATDGAQVSFRVTRRELWVPFEYGYGYGRSLYPPERGQGSQEIAYGTTTTDAEGRFSIRFTPPVVPPAAGRRGWEPGYLFEITADVTDAAGETRTGTRRLPIGRNPLSLRLTGPELADKQQLPSFSLLSTNATGEQLAAAGTLRLLVRRYRPNPPGVPGPAPEEAENEATPELLKTLPFDTKNGPRLELAAALTSLPTGRYRLEALAAGPDSARTRLDFTLYDSQAATVPFATPDWFVALQDSVAPGQPATVLLGSSEADARIRLEVERDGELLRQEWLTLKAGEQRRLVLDSGPATARGPLYIHTTQVRDNRQYVHQAAVPVAEKPQPLQIAISTFRDRLLPGQRETWRVTVRQANGRPADAELLATLYDQSLDAFRPHSLMALQAGSGYLPPRFGWQGDFREFESTPLTRAAIAGPDAVDYPELNTWLGNRDMLAQRAVGLGYGGRPVPVRGTRITLRGTRSASPMMAESKQLNEVVVSDSNLQSASAPAAAEASPPPPAVQPGPDLSAIAARADFRETALWQPALRTDKKGDIVLEFQMPEAVTRWQLLALAHDKSLHTGRLARQLLTQKQVQITPNAPRFFRQGDSFTFQAKFSNLTDQPTSGTAQLFLLDAATGQDLTGQLLQGSAQQTVAAGAHQSTALGWSLSLPADFAPAAVTYRVVVQSQSTTGNAQPADSKGKRKQSKQPGTTGQVASTFTDGEENTLPVLSNRILITESLPLPLAGPGTRTFELPKLTSTSSPTRRNHSLTLELTPNPGWLAVQSLPYLLEYPYECSEQVFSRLYANLLAAHILKSNPRFKAVLAEWQRLAQSGSADQKKALASKLDQNQELKNLLLQETPWVRDAQNENERLARLSTLFDQPRLEAETAASLAKLGRMQLPTGAFPWFERMPEDRYITQLIVAGFGKLSRLGVFDAQQNETARTILTGSLRYLDASLTHDYTYLRKLKGFKASDDHLTNLAVQALYARSFWLQLKTAEPALPAYAFFRQQGAAHWARQPRQLQAQLAVAASRTEGAKASLPTSIMRALKENALHSPELGMYWKEVRGGYYWREAPTETQAVLIEAFAEVANDQKAVDDMKLWLLKQKQVQSWESTRATADACYALLLRGSDLLASAAPLQVQVGTEKVAPGGALAGTGYVKTTWPAADIKPAQGKVTITKTDAGVAWGALYWQYFEDLDKVTTSATTLAVERQLYRETRTAGGPTLTRLSPGTPLKVGEVLVVRLVLRTDRRLEYVHLKDQRAAGLELTAQTSGYRYQNGLGYYESPRDAATNFFFSEVPRGTHVLEYRLRAAQAGDFSGGLSQVQCLYAPEFGAVSAGGRLRVAP